MIPTVAPFVPLPNIYPPSKKLPSKNVNRIDHLLLGEHSSIKNTTNRPLTTSGRPFNFATRRLFSTTSRPPEKKQEVEDNFVGSNKYTSVTYEGTRIPGLSSSGVGAGLLKLAGCNIYGQMYKVGKIIMELSTPCMDCRCTELGVQCRPIKCWSHLK